MLEVQERNKWSARLSAILVAAALPATQDSAGRMCELGERERTCMGRRVSTLKSQVRYCEGFIAWLSRATGLWWPSSAFGAGKKVEQLFGYVSFDAFIVQRDWLEVGFALWKKMGLDSGSSERDFFLTRPNRDLDGCVLAMARYCDAAALILTLPRRWTCIDSLGETQPMLLQNLASCWMEHSERSTITTWARCCGRLPEVIGRMCRWQQSCAEDYARASRLLVEGAQEAIASAIRAGKGEADFLDEENLWDQISWKYGSEFGEAFMEDQISRLRYFGPSARRPNRGDETPRVVDSPIAEELGSTEEVERLKQTFHLADTQLDTEPDLGEVLASSSEDESRPLPPAILLR